MTTSPSQPTQGIVVLSGPSGSGKSTVVERLLSESPIPLYKCVSATTRPPRPGEVNGEAYYFLTRDEFLRRQAAGGFIESEEVFGAGDLYGTLRTEIEKAHAAGAWAFLEIDVRGALKVMEQYPDAVTIFLQAPSPEEYERRLRSRGTESEDKIQRRLRTAKDELRFADRYRHVVVNDDLDRAVEQISEILRTEESKTHA